MYLKHDLLLNKKIREIFQLVLAIVAFVNAEDEAAAPAAVLPFPYYGLGHPYAYAPQVVHVSLLLHFDLENRFARSKQLLFCEIIMKSI